ncbi:hypothetical protein E2C01_022317 [Portunus trituberculatus]|uniref:Uncharacterized protein n=1 Tax=Portunus trituberculatus TaxID=210409 RepID=A0A5B7E6Q5_PORTR|nr:hypothetical protein [Portunus trituberculatus]
MYNIEKVSGDKILSACLRDTLTSKFIAEIEIHHEISIRLGCRLSPFISHRVAASPRLDKHGGGEGREGDVREGASLPATVDHGVWECYQGPEGAIKGGGAVATWGGREGEQGAGAEGRKGGLSDEAGGS